MHDCLCDQSPHIAIHSPAAATIRYEDNSDPSSIGFDYYATIITLNENMEIEVIHQDFDVAQ